MTLLTKVIENKSFSQLEIRKFTILLQIEYLKLQVKMTKCFTFNLLLVNWRLFHSKLYNFKLDYKNEKTITSLPIGLVYTFRVGIFSVNYDLLDDDLLDDNFWSEKSNLVDLS